LVIGIVCIVVLLLIVVVAGVIGVRIIWPPAGSVPEDRGHTRIAEEELVKRYIRNNSKHPDQVEFLRWGPHLSREEFERAIRKGGVDPQEVHLSYDGETAFDYAIRVRFRADLINDPADLYLLVGEVPTKKTHDYVFRVVGKRVFWWLAGNDEWKGKFMTRVARHFPSVDP
jgi:hypothetical protein